MTQEGYRKPIPIPTPETQFFWDKCKEHELWVQRCNAAPPVFLPQIPLSRMSLVRPFMVPNVGQGDPMDVHD